ncbi:hypothetical protein ACLKA6_011925 [Drosophila palustris]
MLTEYRGRSGTALDVDWPAVLSTRRRRLSNEAHTTRDLNSSASFSSFSALLNSFGPNKWFFASLVGHLQEATNRNVPLTGAGHTHELHEQQQQRVHGKRANWQPGSSPAVSPLR